MSLNIKSSLWTAPFTKSSEWHTPTGMSWCCHAASSCCTMQWHKRQYQYNYTRGHTRQFSVWGCMDIILQKQCFPLLLVNTIILVLGLICSCHAHNWMMMLYLQWLKWPVALRARQSLLKGLVKAINGTIARTENKVTTSLRGKATPAGGLVWAETINSQFRILSNYPINPVMRQLGLYMPL